MYFIQTTELYTYGKDRAVVKAQWQDSIEEIQNTYHDIVMSEAE